jgi:hypothetical protein
VRTFKVAKNTIYSWLERVADLKEVLLLYSLCHQFLSQLVEGDELYTKVKENTPPEQSQGWTIVLMERASRFIWELKCGQREHSLFQEAMATLSQVIAQSQDSPWSPMANVVMAIFFLRFVGRPFAPVGWDDPA